MSTSWTGATAGAAGPTRLTGGAAQAGRGESGPFVVGGRYGLGSKEFDPAMVKAVLDELNRDAPRNGFTVGINDDLTGSSLKVDGSFRLEPGDTVRAVLFGLGADGTVGANSPAASERFKVQGVSLDDFHAGDIVTYSATDTGGATKTITKLQKEK
jgi:pyruvate-ferredoxin/flavodoxin oxidoreductase